MGAIKRQKGTFHNFLHLFLIVSEVKKIIFGIERRNNSFKFIRFESSFLAERRFTLPRKIKK
jgi:hypothetical protein